MAEPWTYGPVRELYSHLGCGLDQKDEIKKGGDKKTSLSDTVGPSIYDQKKLSKLLISLAMIVPQCKFHFAC